MTVNSIANTQMQTSMIRLASGQRINSAKDDAAGLAISEKIGAQIRGLDQGTANTMDMQNLVNTAEGALSSIGDSLQRIRELSLQASNGIYTNEDRALMQKEADQLMSQIDSVSSGTQFNTKNLLDGSFNNQNTASDANGNGPSVSIGNMSSSMLLGPGKLDLVAGVDLSRIDNAMSMVNNQRSYLGAMSNRFDSTVATNQITSLNLSASKSRIADADIAKEAMNLSKENVLQQYRIQAQKRKQDEEQNKTLPLLSRLM